MLQLIHMTAAYSNAVLVAVLPHVSDFARQLNLPIPQPVSTAQVGRCSVSPLQGEVGAGLWLTNNYWFGFHNGHVGSFRSPDDWFTMADEYWNHLERYTGKDQMTTNDVIQLARDSFRKLGRNAEDFGVNGLPTKIEGPYDNEKLGHIPYCRVEWNSQEAKNQEAFNRSYTIRFDVDMQRKQVVGMSLSGKNFWRPNLTVSIVPELESEYRQRIQVKMFTRTNAPTSFNPAAPARPVFSQTNSIIRPANSASTTDLPNQKE